MSFFEEFWGSAAAWRWVLGLACAFALLGGQPYLLGNILGSLAMVMIMQAVVYWNKKRQH